MSKSSSARIRIVNQSILVHFEKVGSKTRFELIRQRWQIEFPQSVWNKQYKAWELPITNLKDVQEFCGKMFWQVKIELVGPPPRYPQQLTLNL